MYDILLVDDEPGHLTGLSNMLHRLRPEYGICTARNGREALDQCSIHSFQIIISDIRMPLMDGLHFLEQLPPSQTPRRVIYLSGYNHFEYAQQAMSLGSFEYMLKPLDTGKFISVLERMEKSLEQEFNALQEYERLAVRLDAAEPAFQHRLLNEWIEGTLAAAEDHEELIRILGFRGSGCLLVICTKEVRTPESVMALLQPYGLRTGFACRREPHLLIVASQLPLDSDLTQALVRLEMNVGISDYTDPLNGNVTEAYDEARIAAMCGFYAQAGESTVYLAKECRLDISRVLISDSRLAGLLGEAVAGWDGHHSLEVTVEKVICRMLGEEAPPLPEVLIREVTQLLFQVIYDLEILRANTQAALLRRASGLKDGIGGYQELIASSTDLLEDIARTVAEAKRDPKDKVMTQCLTYIDNHYMEDLSQETVAARFHFNPSYFCQLFKSRVNVTFNQYVTGLRLNKAKELLTHSNAKVYRIAEQLGYHDVKYFNRVFKKETALTPEEYRSLIRSLTEI
ncbi:response regulator transcription factor [Paenibacillus donghaensis]|uniref:DNA-binding response regulator n=1 Tax=Paenibacillus donghaensis TaxID=414771 RepID=A0A2Z2KT08_9BACL|nr:helix-turn-helix domain-containing protein [Paenibacillus donghaensis]ASA22428.1 hypothetical protein B9T62_17515 [Paenibacillus donghaensis]